MGEVRESALKVSLIDDVSKPARSVAQALKDAEARVKDVAKAMSGMGAGDKLTKSLSQLKLSKADIEQVAKAWQDYSKSANLAADSSKWTKQQANDVKAWESQTIRSLREVKREQQSFFKATAEAEKQAAAQQEQARKAAQERANRPGVMGRVMNHVAGQMAVMAAGGAVEHGVKSAVEQAAEAEQLRFRIRELSRNDRSEGGFADKLAAEIAAKYPSITTGKALDNYVELRGNSVGQNGMVDQAIARKNAFAAARAQNAALALGFEMTPVDMQSLLKGVEGSGRADDPKAVEKITDAYIRAKQVFGSAIAASMIRDYTANAKSANFAVGDDQFYLSNMVRMSEGNASRLGNEVNQTLSTLVGGTMKKAAGEWLIGLGLADAKDMEKTGGGNVRFKHGIKDAALLQTNQSAWATGPLKSALESHGVVSDKNVAARMKMLRDQELKSNPNAQIDERFLRNRAEEGLIAAYLAKAGFRTTVSDNLAHFIGNERLIARDTAAMKNASGLDAGERLGENPVAAFKELTESLTNFGTVMGAPAMKDVGGALDSMAKGLASFSKVIADWQKDNPRLGKIASWGALGAGGATGLRLLYGGLQGFTSGFGLKTSAAALDASAAALTGAAEKLAVGGSMPNLLKKTAPLVEAAPASLGVLPTLGTAAAPVALGLAGGAMVAAVIYGAMKGLVAVGAVVPTKPSALAGSLHANQAARDRIAADQERGRGLRHGWRPPSRGGADVAPKVDTSQVAAVPPVADQAHAALQQISGDFSPRIDTSSVANLIAMLQRAQSLIASIASGESRAQKGVPALGATSHGHFGFGGPSGE